MIVFSKSSFSFVIPRVPFFKSSSALSLSKRSLSSFALFDRYCPRNRRNGSTGYDKSVSLTTTPSHQKRQLRLFSSTCSNNHDAQSSIDNDIDKFLTINDDVIITYMTDVEGDKLYLDRYVEMSKVLTFVDAPADANNNDDDNNNFPYEKCIDFTESNALLVFGGDIMDKGGFDLYVCRQLLDLKRRHPNRVVFVLGNRDINKLRILQEIGILGHALPKHPGLLWLKGTGRIGDPTSDDLLPPNTASERLKWILQNTMGSPDAFEHRRRELAWEIRTRNFCNENENGHNNLDEYYNNDDCVDSVTDQEVVESYQRSCHPKGELGQYISHACLAKKMGPVLFVHGSLPLTNEIIKEAKIAEKSVWDDMTPFMPWIKAGQTAKDYGVVTIDDWLRILNTFCYEKVQEWKDEIAQLESTIGEKLEEGDEQIWAYRGGYQYGPKYSGLIQYGMGMLPGAELKKINPTVVYNSFTPSGMPERFIPGSEEADYMHCTKDFFDRANIELILVGHKPQGCLPTPIRVDSSSWVLCCDTSYSGDTIWYNNYDNGDSNEMGKDGPRNNLGRGNSVSFRGDFAVTEVLLELNNAPSPSSNTSSKLQSVIYHGILSDGTKYGTVNLLSYAHNSSIGQVAPDDLVPSAIESPHNGQWWTKSIFADGTHLFHAGKGFHVWNFITRPASRA